MVRVEFLRNVRTGDKLYLAGLTTRIEEEHVNEMLAHGLIRLLEPLPPVEQAVQQETQSVPPSPQMTEVQQEPKKRGRRSKKEAQ